MNLRPASLSTFGDRRYPAVGACGARTALVAYAALIASAAFIAGCVRDPVGPELTVPLPSTKGIYVLNEGNFGRGNSTLTFYDDASRTVYQDVYSAVNSRPLGDVGNSIVIRNGRIYIVVNNSNKVEILDEATNASVGTVEIGGG